MSRLSRTLFRVALPVVAMSTLALCARPVVAAPGDPRVVQGTVEWPNAPSPDAPFLVIRSDDGRAYTADLTAAQRRSSGALTTGTRVALLGVEGGRPFELTAMVIGVGDASSLGLAPGTTLSPVASPVSAAIVPPAPAAAAEDMWRVDGVVQSVSGASVRLRTATGSSATVDVSGLSEGTLRALRPGERVSLFGVPRSDRKLIANGYIQSDTVPPSASPRLP
jgi:hypothetical protein